MRAGKHVQADTSNRQAGPRLPEIKAVRILLVDDDPQARTLIDMALAEAAFERAIDVAVTATRGLQMIRADVHDIYLVDHLLPDGTGLQVIHDAKVEGSSKPFILMTGYGSEALDEAASREGAADYVEKDMVGAQLERSIRYALSNWQASRLLLDREEQLRQAQKMEAIGRLAGGVAHDFNNLLTAIVGYADMIMERVEPADQTAREVREIRKAADRATSLTQQLLAFSRKQFLNPTVVDLNAVASELLQMLPRVIGEHIRTTSVLAERLAAVKADASQMEQVFVNLVLNSRDAMPDGGDIVIETANVTLGSERMLEENLNLSPGDYVMLAIADTGIGMDAKTRARAFEPFFTTKPKGKGTGLGLATVYGIVEQSGGGISITSAVNQGTTIRVYLPMTDARHASPRAASPRGGNSAGTESLLLVEDNDAVRTLASTALRRRGYTVFEASSAEDALAWANTTRSKLDLLVTDVIMPGQSGPSLAKQLLAQYPRLRVLYMSGYADDVAGRQAALHGHAPLLQKPFTPGKLAERIRYALDAKN